MAKKNNTLKIKKLREEIKTLDSLELPNTKTRAKAVLSYLDGQGTYLEIAKDFKVSRGAITNWTKKYLEEGMEGLKESEKLPISKPKRKNSGDKEKAENLDRELKKLNPEQFPNTKIRAEAIHSYLRGDGTLEKIQNDIEKKYGIKTTKLNTWTITYVKDGMDELMKLENIPLFKIKRDTSNDEEIADILVEELKKLNTEELPNTITRAEAVLSYLRGDGTQKDIGKSIGVDQTAVKNWINLYTNIGIDELKKLEKIPLSKPLRDNTKDKEKANTLEEELKHLNKDEFPNTIERANAVLRYLKGEGSYKKIANDIGSNNPVTIGTWVRIYDEKKLNGLKKIEDKPLYITRKDTSNNKANTLKNEIKNLNPDEFPNTIIRANAVLSHLKDKKSFADIAKEINVKNEKNVAIWVSRYQKYGMDLLKNSEQIPITNDTNQLKETPPTAVKSEEKANSLKKEIKNLNPDEFPNTIIRAKAVLSYLKDKKSFADIAKEINVKNEKNVAIWVSRYQKYGMDLLKNSEQIPITNNTNKLKETPPTAAKLQENVPHANKRFDLMTKPQTPRGAKSNKRSISHISDNSNYSHKKPSAKRYKSGKTKKL